MRSRFLGSLLRSLRCGLLAAACAAPLGGQTVVQWQAAVSGNWFTAANWNPAVVPDFASPNSYRATVSVTGTPYIITANGSTNIDLAGFDVSSADARIFFNLNSTSIGLTLASGSSTWSAGTVEFGTARLIGAGNTATTVNIGSAAQLLFTTNTDNRTVSSLALNNSGLIRATTGIVSLSSLVLNNQPGAVIHADGADIRFQGGVTLANSGILRATGPNGILRFQVPLATSALGTVELLSGGRALLQTTLNNSGNTLAAPTGGGSYELVGGTISGGTIAAGAVAFTSSNGTLSGATLSGDLVLAPSTYVTLTNSTTFIGTNLALGSSSQVHWQQVGTLTGKALTQDNNSLIYISGVNSALTLASGSITGDIHIISDGSNGTAFTNSGTIAHNGDSGQIYARSLTNTNLITTTTGSLTIGNNGSYATTNTGTISATGSSTFLFLEGSVDNNGTILGQNQATVRFTGNNAAANLGTVQLSGGARAQLNGTIDNTAVGSVLNGPIILSSPTNLPGAYELLGGTINGGTIAAGALTFTGTMGTLSGATLTGDLLLPTSSTYVALANDATFTGTNLNLGPFTQVYWQQGGSLTGKALTFGNGSLLYISGVNSSLTLASGSTAQGDIQIYSDGNNGTAFINQGTIVNDGDGGQIYARTFVNAGNITSNAKPLSLGLNSPSYLATNTGTITADGSGALITLNGSFDNNGTLLASNQGIVRFTGSNTTANLGSVQLSNGGRAQLSGIIDNTAVGSVLNGPTILSTPTNLPGAYELLGGTINGGTIAAGAITFTGTMGTLSGTTLTGDLLLPTTSTYVALANDATFTGTNLNLGTFTQVYWQQDGTLVDKTLTFGSGSLLYISGVNSKLTFDADSSATGDIQIYSDGNNGTTFTNQGNILNNGDGGQIYARSFVNAGTITSDAKPLSLGLNSPSYLTTNTGTIIADGSGALITLNGAVDNNGTLLATDQGVLRFSGSNTTANLGTVQLSNGGRAQLNGTIDNTAVGSVLNGPIILSSPTNLPGAYELLGGTINGGTIAAGALTFTGTMGTLSGATLTGDLLLPTSSTYVALANDATFTGTNLNLGPFTQVYWQQGGSLTGKALTFGNGSLLYISGVNSTLTLASGSTAQGDIQIYSDGNNGTAFTNQGAIVNDGDGGQIYARSFVNAGTITSNAKPLSLGLNSPSYLTTNTGTITADGSGALIALNGSFDNNGTLIAQNQGILRFTGSITTVDLGTIQLVNNGRVQLGGTLDNSGQTLAAFPALAGLYELLGGTINGGTIAAGALTFTSSNGTLSGVAFQGDLTLPSNTYVGLAGNTTVGGNAITLGSGSQLHWQQSGTLADKAIAFTGGGLIFLSGGANHPLTLASNTTATGSISIYTDGSIGNNVTNQGTLNHTGGSGQLYAHQFLNGGTISASAGSLNLGVNATGYSFANSGTINVTGANVSLNAPAGENFLNQGLIHIQSGNLLANGKLLNDDPGTIRGAGTIFGGVTMAGGTLEPGNSIGTLTLNGGAFSITDATVFAFELGGSTADRLLFVNPTAPVNLGTGLVTLSLTLLSAPTPNATYNFLQISSGGSGIAGTFANLPVTGSTLTANFGGTPYQFAITYQTNLVSLQAIPEPGTYALMAAGLAAMWMLARRRRG